ncbi:MAG: Unknown protein [uncultured Sulfurovum sp.]|uniref:Uncharacterized protein n=1 Tax=uncultured Sulfurovum sp. TaxID=269237 RepID=A0A6S6RWT5_9BACT|nr:MAG: Unknown protein [uncultured Sulfurovum sp.]
MDAKLLITGTIQGVQFKDEKVYDGKVSEAKLVLSFVSLFEDGSVNLIKVKAPTDFKGKRGEKVSLEVLLSANDGSIFYRLA